MPSTSNDRSYTRFPYPAPHTDRHLDVRVSQDYFIRASDVDYTVSRQLVGRKVAVRMSSRDLMVHPDGKETARPQLRSR